MNPSELLTSHVLEVMKAALDLKANISQIDPSMLPTEMARLYHLLNADGDVRGLPAYVGQGGAYGPQNPAPRDSQQSVFLGARYALACWIDEIIVDDPSCPWRERWKENMLETQLFGGSSQRRWRFWAQAELAERQVGSDALEVYFWCVMLGFRERPSRTNPDAWDNPADWLGRVKKRIEETRKAKLLLPTDLTIRTSVPPLAGPAAVRRAGRVLFVVVAITLFIVAAVLAQYFTNKST